MSNSLSQKPDYQSKICLGLYLIQHENLLKKSPDLSPTDFSIVYGHYAFPECLKDPHTVQLSASSKAMYHWHYDNSPQLQLKHGNAVSNLHGIHSFTTLTCALHLNHFVALQPT